MSRYIDADKLQETYKELHDGKRSLLIDTEPTADVRENVRGEWRDIQIGNWHGVECTACKIAHDKHDVPHKNGGIVAWNFCPDCGADMRQGSTDRDMDAYYEAMDIVQEMQER